MSTAKAADLIGAACVESFQVEDGALPSIARWRDKALLAVLLVHQRRLGKASFYHPYISTLPETYEEPALWWSDQQVCVLLQGTNLAFALRERRDNFKRLYRMALKSTQDLFSEQPMSW